MQASRSKNRSMLILSKILSVNFLTVLVENSWRPLTSKNTNDVSTIYMILKYKIQQSTAVSQ